MRTRATPWPRAEAKPLTGGVNVTASALRHARGSKWIEGSERILSASRRTCAARVGWPVDTSPGQPTHHSTSESPHDVTALPRRHTLTRHALSAVRCCQGARSAGLADLGDAHHQRAPTPCPACRNVETGARQLVPRLATVAAHSSRPHRRPCDRRGCDRPAVRSSAGAVPSMQRREGSDDVKLAGREGPWPPPLTPRVSPASPLADFESLPLGGPPRQAVFASGIGFLDDRPGLWRIGRPSAFEPEVDDQQSGFVEVVGVVTVEVVVGRGVVHSEGHARRLS